MRHKRRKKKLSPPKLDHRHSNALRGSEVQQLLIELRKSWARLNLVERGDALQALVNRGCTRRGLAKNLGCDEGTVRRSLSIAQLSQVDRKLVELGHNPQPLLLEARHDRLMKDHQDWLSAAREQAREQAQVDAIARLLHEAMTEAGIVASSHRWQLLDEVWYRAADCEALRQHFPLSLCSPVANAGQS